MAQFQRILRLAAWFSALATLLGSVAWADKDCSPSNPYFSAAMDFQHVGERSFENAEDAKAALLAAWQKIDKNGDGQAVLQNACVGDIVGTALRNHNYGLADILMGPDYNFTPSEFDIDSPKGRQTAMQIAGDRCDAEQILVLRLFGVPEKEAKKEQRHVSDDIIYFSAPDGKIHRDASGNVIDPRGTHPVDYGALVDQIQHKPHVLSAAQKQELAKEDKEGKAYNKEHRAKCASALWALSVPLDKLTAADDKSLHSILTDQNIPDWGPNECGERWHIGPCKSPVQNIMAAVQHVKLRDQKKPDPDQLNIYVSRGTEIPDSVRITPAANAVSGSH